MDTQTFLISSLSLSLSLSLHNLFFVISLSLSLSPCALADEEPVLVADELPGDLLVLRKPKQTATPLCPDGSQCGEAAQAEARFWEVGSRPFTAWTPGSSLGPILHIVCLDHTPSTAGTFRKKFPEKFQKDPGNALRAFPGIPLESTAGIPQAL